MMMNKKNLLRKPMAIALFMVFAGAVLLAYTIPRLHRDARYRCLDLCLAIVGNALSLSWCISLVYADPRRNFPGRHDGLR